MYNCSDFNELLKNTEAHLLKRTGLKFKAVITTSLSQESISDLMEIENKAFKPELRYIREEFLERAKKKNFSLLAVYAFGKPIGFALGYEDDNETFYLDTLATLMESKEIGTTIFYAMAIYCFKKGFRHITIHTESGNEERSPIRFFEKMGFYKVPCNPSEGMAMKKDLNLHTINKYIYEISRR